MRLLYAPGSCSISPHIVLEEIGAPFETQRVGILEGETRSEAFLRINPKGKVPVLVLAGGATFTEAPVILQYLARRFPDVRLLPADPQQELEALQLCSYIAGTLHGLGLSPLLRPEAFCGASGRAAEVRAEGERVLGAGFQLIARRLGEATQFFEQFSIGDAALFYLEHHADRLGVAMPPAIVRHWHVMCARRSVRAVLEREGLGRSGARPS
jgi:glutathione S-transferase